MSNRWQCSAVSSLGHSADSTFQACPKKYYWQYIKGLTPPSSVPLIVGSAIHVALSVYHKLADPSGSASPIPGLTGRASQAMSEGMTYIKEATSHLGDDDMNRVSFDFMRTLRGYFAEYPEDPWKVLATEQEFDLELWPGIRSTGRIDGIVEWEGQTLVLEHKTTSFTPLRYYQEHGHGGQITRYCRAASLLYGKPVHGALLNLLQKPPKSGVGRPKFARYVLVRTPAEIEALRRDLLIVRSAQALSHAAEVYPQNTDRCFDYFQQCPFYRLCFQGGETEENLAAFGDPTTSDE